MPGTDDISATQRAVSKYLKAVREQRGWSRTETGRRIGVSKTTISRNEEPPEDYRYVMSTTSLRKLAQQSGVAPPPELLELIAGGNSNAIRGPDVVPLESDGPATRAKRSEWKVSTRALELAGYMPGDIVTIDATVPPRNGDVVLAQIRDEAAAGAQTALRRFQAGARLPFLMVATADPELMMQEPDYVDNARVRIVGTVIRSVRERA